MQEKLKGIYPVFKQETDIKDLIDKLDEEIKELKLAYYEYKATGKHPEEIVKENKDIRQVCIAIEDYCQRVYKVSLDSESIEHNIKLMNRKIFPIKGMIFENYIGE